MSKRTHKGTKYSRLVERIGDLRHAYLQKAEGYQLAAKTETGRCSLEMLQQLHAAFSKASEDLIDLLRDR